MLFPKKDISAYDLVNRLPNNSWQSLMDLDAFGQSSLPLLLKLSVQFCRFQWSIKILDTIDTQYLRKLVSRILRLLEDVRKIAAKYSRVGSSSSKTTSVAGGVPNIRMHWSMILPIKPYTSNLNTVSTRQTSLTSRQWKASDERSVKEKISKISEQNDQLERLLPVSVRESLYQQGLPRMILVEDNRDNVGSIVQALQDTYPTINKYAYLWLTPPPNEDVMERYPQNELRTTATPGTSSSRMQLIDWQTDTGSTTRALIEKYSIPKTSAEKGASRLSKLLQLCAFPDKPVDLRIVDTTHVERDRESLILKNKLPNFANPTTQPVTLHSLLNQGPTPNFSSGPPLEQRLQLAFDLASTVHALSLIRFPHGDINSHNTIFFRSPTNPNSILLHSPYLTNFRLHLSLPPCASAIYQHPNLHSPSSLTPYNQRHEIYSLGLLLFEIITWTALDHSPPPPDPTLSPHQQKTRMQEHVTSTMTALGTATATPRLSPDPRLCAEYTTVIQKCLEWADDRNKLHIYPDSFYWDIVIVLAKQLEASKNPMKEGRAKEILNSIWVLV